LVFSDTGYNQAIPYLKETVRNDPGNAQAWLALGMAYQNVERPAEAKGPYQQYLRLKPNGAMADEVRKTLQAMP
jgi:Flp pilus assembly protein TadD